MFKNADSVKKNNRNNDIVKNIGTFLFITPQKLLGIMGPRRKMCINPSYCF